MAKIFAQTVFVLLAVALTFSKSSSTFATPIKARHFLQGFKPVIFTNILDENTATTEAATTNLLEIEAANTAQTAAAFDHETAATTLIKKRHFLNNFKPVIFTNILDENTATTEAATTNLLEIEAANTAQTAAAFDHETAATTLIKKRHFLNGFKPVIFTNVLDENTATTEAATTNLLEIEAANTAQTAAAFDHESAITAFAQL
ncbi:10452_t:CDS:1 [Ambispora gerdemannii]|uniref:10452_t:CDS:1 n=1 Tax=Ambispora gerdemannii TaxID=144530 RepID=A0A9N9B3R0_9GLOM|nr:10452_t:CDS:1 [Ambispora gerdemannii]